MSVQQETVAAPKPHINMRRFLGALVMLLAVGSGYSQADSVAVSGKGAQPQIAPLSKTASGSGEYSEQLAKKIAELDAILAEKQRLEDALRVEKSAQSAAALQSSNAKKLIRMELEDFFAQASNRERLDSLLEDYKRSADEEQAALQRVQSVEKDLSAKQLSFSQAARDVERLKAQLASEVRKRNSKKNQSMPVAWTRRSISTNRFHSAARPPRAWLPVWLATSTMGGCRSGCSITTSGFLAKTFAIRSKTSSSAPTGTAIAPRPSFLTRA